GIGTPPWDAGEDVKYYIFPVPANNTKLLARFDHYADADGVATVLANKLDELHIHYFSQRVTYNLTYNSCDISGASQAEVASPSAAQYLVIAVCVRQDEVGKPGSPGYQPVTHVVLTSDVTLRNSNLPNY